MATATQEPPVRAAPKPFPSQAWAPGATLLPAAQSTSQADEPALHWGDRLMFRIWLGCVALIIVGSLLGVILRL